MVNKVDTRFTLQNPLQNERGDIDDAFQVLANPHRRAIVSSLLDQEAGTFEDELVDDVLREGTSPVDGPAKTRSHVAVKLHHVHLPKLADLGLIEWNRDQQFVEPMDSLSALEPLLDVASTL
jgi:hypothetical protein